MKLKQIGGLIIAAVLFIAVGVTSVLTNRVSEKIATDSISKILAGGYELRAPMHDYIAVVSVEGAIQEQTQSSIFDVAEGYRHTTTMEYIDDLMNDGNNKGILLYVDSPGGTVYESEELYLKLLEYKDATNRPIWNYMAHYAASGGYMASVAADKIYANPNTVTGSIGVIMSGYDMTGLYEKLGIRYVSITSGKNKDGSKLTDEQIAIYQEQINEYYRTFVDKVAAGRGMSAEDVYKLADGRTYTAAQAKDNGLIDEISLYEDMKDSMGKEFGTDTFYELQNPDNTLASLLVRVKDLQPKSEAQVLTETAAKMESGVPMYYAEQLQ